MRRESEIPLREHTTEGEKEEAPPQSEAEEAPFEEFAAEKKVHKRVDFLNSEKNARPPSFLSRLLGGILPSVKEDDLLLLLLLLLLSREEGNEEILLLLAILLFGD